MGQYARPNLVEMPTVSNKANLQPISGRDFEYSGELRMKDRFAPRKYNSSDAHYLASLRQYVAEKIWREEVCWSVIQRVVVTQTVTAMQIADVCQLDA
jgi:hypothetical protein